MNISKNSAYFGAALLLIASTAFASSDATTGYQKKLNQIEINLTTMQANARARGDSWVHLERLAAVYLERAQLTGNFNDYVAAHDAIDQAFELAESGAGPFLTSSRLNFTTHRLPQALEDLTALENAILIDEQTKQHVKGMRADIHLQQGEYATAHELYRDLEDEQQSVESAVRLAFYFAAKGRKETADTWLETASARAEMADAHIRGWLKLQHGILDLHRGNLDEARAHYEEGLAIFPDYWLIEEHIAEIDALQGNVHIAEKSYRDLIERTNSPLFMIALSEILDSRPTSDEQEEAAGWIKKAENAYKTQLDQLPEVVAGHALDFFIDTAEPEFTVLLAERNYSLRPNGEAAVQLIQSYLNSGEIEKAKPILDRTLQSGYSSADLHKAASDLYEEFSYFKKANHHHAIAVAMNPLIDS